MVTHPTDDDLPPEPPERPAPDECCASGCDVCVFDLFEQAIDRYRVEREAWEKRRAMRDRAEEVPCRHPSR